MQAGLRRIACLAASCCWLSATALATDDSPARRCQSLIVAERGDRPTNPSVALLLPRMTIEAPGHFCLDRDVHQASLRDPLRRAPVFSAQEAIVRIRASNTTLDLGGHTVSNAMPNGMTIIWFSRFAIGERGGTRLRKASIRNGRLVSPGANGVGIDLTASKPYGPRSLQIAAIPEGARVTDVFEDTGHLIESMTIAAGSRGILIDGKNNVIRNNRIIVDGTTAIVAQGPGIIIENNVIELKNDSSLLDRHDRQRESKTPFAIRLIQADGAIVRNNEIRLVDPRGTATLPAAIQLVESTGATVEGNRFAGMDAPVHADAASAFRDRHNEVKPCRSGAMRFRPPDEAADAARLRAAACR